MPDVLGLLSWTVMNHSSAGREDNDNSSNRLTVPGLSSSLHVFTHLIC